MIGRGELVILADTLIGFKSLFWGKLWVDGSDSLQDIVLEQNLAIGS